MLKFIAHLLCL